MSETNQTGSQEAVSDEDRVIAMFGLDDAGENTAESSDADDAEQPDEGAAPDDESDQPETEEGDDEAQTASIDPPTFWTKEAKEHWDAIPPSTQEYLVQREAERNSEVERSQRESAEARRAAQQLAGEVAQERAYLQQHLLPALQEVNKRLLWTLLSI
jgi:hypothetical protein